MSKFFNNSNAKGISTVEYIILITAIIATLLIFLRPRGTFDSALGNTLGARSSDLIDMSQRYRKSL